MSTTITISTKLFDRLKALAESYEDLDDDFSSYDWCGGNYDDAFFGGANHGAEGLASEIIESYNANKV